MKRLVFVLIVLVTALGAPSLFACEDCPDFENCITVEFGAATCKFFPNGTCAGAGICPLSSAVALQAEYRIAAVRVVEPNGKPLPKAQPQPQPKAAPVLAAAR